MHESWNLGRLFIPSKIGLGALVLPERMKFANEKRSSVNQCPKRLGEHERKLSDMLKHQVANNQIDRPIVTRPWLPNVGHVEVTFANASFRLALSIMPAEKSRARTCSPI